MRAIKELVRNISAELDDASAYIDQALKYKDEDRDLAEMYYNLSRGEMEHADQEHNQAVRIIKAYTGEVPAAMKAVWDYEHERMIDDQTKIKVRQALFKS